MFQKYFHSVCFSFSSLNKSFQEQPFLILIKSLYQFVHLWIMLLVSHWRNLGLTQYSKCFLLCFLLEVYLVVSKGWWNWSLLLQLGWNWTSHFPESRNIILKMFKVQFKLTWDTKNRKNISTTHKKQDTQYLRTPW